MALPDLQFWNCMDYGVTCIQKQFIGSMDFEVYTKNHGRMRGQYIATLDNYHVHADEIDYSTSEQPEEHKSFNLLELENGQYCLYPNNRMRVYDNSLTPKEPKQPDFRVSTEYYQVENGYEYRLGDTEEYYYKQKTDTTPEWQHLYGDVWAVGGLPYPGAEDSDIPGSAILSQGC
jgi:hypothetical protein